MDALAAEIARKKALLASAKPSSLSATSKYVKRGDLTKKEQEERDGADRLLASQREAKQKARLEEEARAEEDAKAIAAAVAAHAATRAAKESTKQEEVEKGKEEAEVDDDMKVDASLNKRKRDGAGNDEAAKAEEKDHDGANDDDEDEDDDDDDDDDDADADDDKKSNSEAASSSEPKPPKEDVTLRLSAPLPSPPPGSSNPYKYIMRFFKTLLNKWSDLLAARPAHVRISTAGKVDTMTQKQCRDYIRPLFKLLKSSSLNSELLTGLHNIVNSCRVGEFVVANATYIDLTIGRSAWPIGVTMVGIHARAGREKINDAKRAHVLNDEMTRKFLTSVKRLITFYQERGGGGEGVGPSKKVR